MILLQHYFTNNESLKSELRVIEYNIFDYKLQFNSDNGVFSKNKIDYGSRLLVETFLKYNQEKIESILDVGTGYGFIGITIAKVLNIKPTLIDINKRAVHLTKMNLKENNLDGETYISQSYENVSGFYDLIITNPPIRAGKSVVLDILINAENYLREKGCIWFVMRKDQGVMSILKKLQEFYATNIIKKDKGFYIIKMQKIS